MRQHFSLILILILLLEQHQQIDAQNVFHSYQVKAAKSPMNHLRGNYIPHQSGPQPARSSKQGSKKTKSTILGTLHDQGYDGLSTKAKASTKSPSQKGKGGHGHGRQRQHRQPYAQQHPSSEIRPTRQRFPRRPTPVTASPTQSVQGNSEPWPPAISTSLPTIMQSTTPVPTDDTTRSIAPISSTSSPTHDISIIRTTASPMENLPTPTPTSIPTQSTRVPSMVPTASIGTATQSPSETYFTSLGPSPLILESPADSDAPSVRESSQPSLAPTSAPSDSEVPTTILAIPSVSDSPSQVPSFSQMPSERPSESPSASEVPTGPTVSFHPSISEEPSSFVASSSAYDLSEVPSWSGSTPPSSNSMSPSQSVSPSLEPSVQANNETASSSDKPSVAPSTSLVPSTSLAPSQQTENSSDAASFAPSMSLAPSLETSNSSDATSADQDGEINALDAWYMPLDDDGLPDMNLSLIVVSTGMDCTRSSLNAPYKQLDRSKYPLLYVQRGNAANDQDVVTRQILLRMDLSDPTIPDDGSITKATLRILSTTVHNPIHVTMHRVLVPWEDTEREVASGGIFLDFGSSNQNAVPAAHHMLSANGQQALLEPSVQFFGTHQAILELDVTEDVKYWVEENGPNHGWLFVPATSDEFGRWGMWGLDSISTPELQIEYNEMI